MCNLKIIDPGDSREETDQEESDATGDSNIPQDATPLKEDDFGTMGNRPQGPSSHGKTISPQINNISANQPHDISTQEIHDLTSAVFYDEDLTSIQLEITKAGQTLKDLEKNIVERNDKITKMNTDLAMLSSRASDTEEELSKHIRQKKFIIKSKDEHIANLTPKELELKNRTDKLTAREALLQSVVEKLTIQCNNLEEKQNLLEKRADRFQQIGDSQQPFPTAATRKNQESKEFKPSKFQDISQSSSDSDVDEPMPQKNVFNATMPLSDQDDDQSEFEEGGDDHLSDEDDDQLSDEDDDQVEPEESEDDLISDENDDQAEHEGGADVPLSFEDVERAKLGAEDMESDDEKAQEWNKGRTVRNKKVNIYTSFFENLECKEVRSIPQGVQGKAKFKMSLSDYIENDRRADGWFWHKGIPTTLGKFKSMACLPGCDQSGNAIRILQKCLGHLECCNEECQYKKNFKKANISQIRDKLRSKSSKEKSGKKYCIPCSSEMTLIKCNDTSLPDLDTPPRRIVITCEKCNIALLLYPGKHSCHGANKPVVISKDKYTEAFKANPGLTVPKLKETVISRVIAEGGNITEALGEMSNFKELEKIQRQVRKSGMQTVEMLMEALNKNEKTEGLIIRKIDNLIYLSSKEKIKKAG
jgi:hypothetical protein